jgi:Ca2+/Na+ antiporter
MSWIQKLKDEKKQVQKYDQTISEINIEKSNSFIFEFSIFILTLTTFFTFIFSNNYMHLLVVLLITAIVAPFSLYKIKKFKKHRAKELENIIDKKKKLLDNSLLKSEKYINLLFQELKDVGLENVEKEISEEIILKKRILISLKSKMKGPDFLINETMFLETINNEEKNKELIND